MIKTITPQRTSDKHGSGAWQASRGSRRHNGIDYAVWPGSVVLSATIGMVTKIGWPYSPEDPDKGHLRYVEVTTPLGDQVRYFYIEPCVGLGDHVSVDQPLGVAQDLTKVYNGITPHIHIGVKRDGKYINPEEFFKVHSKI